MDLMTLSILFFTIVITSSMGYVIIQWLWPQYNLQIDIIKAYKAEDYHKVISLTENKISTYKSLDVFLFAAKARMKLGQYQEALLWYETALRKIEISNNDKILIEIDIADIYLQLNQHEKAEMHYRMALNFNSDHEIATYKLASLCYLDNRLDICRKLIRPILKKNPNLIDMRKLYAECLTQLHMYTKSIRHYGLLERVGENISDYYYAITLKMLKMYDKAYLVYSQILITDKKHHEKIVRDLVEICILLKHYHEGLGILERYLPQISSHELLLELRYLRANLFYHRGDQMLALQEYQNLYNENPTYKDLSMIMDKSKYWLSYPFLYNYFTSNESIFEQVITRIMPPGSMIIRRTMDYYLALRENTAYIFYRHINPMSARLSNDIDIIISQNCPNIAFLETWSLQGLAGHYTMSGAEYRFILRTLDDFLQNIKEVVDTMENTESYISPSFVEGFKDAPEIIPLSKDIEEILNSENIDPILNDELLNKALQK